MLDRWILSRAAGWPTVVGQRLRDVDAVGATPRDLDVHRRPLDLVSASIPRPDASREPDDTADRDAAFATLHEALVATSRMLAPILPFLVRRDVPEPGHVGRPDRAGQRPSDALAGGGDRGASRRRARAVDGDRAARRRARADAAGRQTGSRRRQPLARGWLAVPGGDGGARDRSCSTLIASEINVKARRTDRRRLASSWIAA